jgi:hypothetical protein
MLQIQTGQYHSWNRRMDLGKGFYAMGGFKINVIVNNTYDVSMTEIKNSGYVTELNNWAGTQSFAGFGTFKCVNSGSGNLDFDILAMLAFEAGVKWRLNDEMFLYTGAYFDYGLNDPTKDARKSVSDYDYSSNVKADRPVDLKDFGLVSVSDRVNVMTIGVKLRLSFIRNASPYDCPRGF